MMLRQLSLAACMLAATIVVSPAQEAPQRIVSIGGSVTEIIYALGAEDRLVARDSTSVFPPEALDLPDIGYMRALSAEGVLSVNPDLIVAIEGSGPPETIDVLDKASVPMTVVPDRYDSEGIVDKIEAIGEVLGVGEQAEELAAQVEADLAAAEEMSAGIEDRKRVLFILSVQDGRIMGAGTGTAANGIITMAGGVNAIEGVEGYKPLSQEALVAAAPDVILTMDRAGMDHAASAKKLLAHPALAATPAGQNGSLVHMDAAYLLGFGPRTAAAVRDLTEALYGRQGG